MAKDRLDEMREKLRLDGLEEAKKKEIFNKFVDAGGQVVDLNKEARKRELKQKLDAVKDQVEKTQQDKIKRRELVSQAKSRKSLDLSAAGQKDNPVNKWIERVSSKLGCVFSGILSLNGDIIKNGFKELILTEYQNVLLNSRMVLASLLYQDKFVAYEVKKRFLLDTVFPYYFELLYRFDQLYDDNLFNQLIILKQSVSAAGEVKPLLKKVFKDIFVLQPYYYSLKTGVEKALQLEKEMRKLDGAITFANIRKIQASIDFVFTKVYPKLFALLDYYYKCDTVRRPMAFKDYIGLDYEDTVGYFTAAWKEEFAAAIRNEEKAGEKEAAPGQKNTQAEGEENVTGEPVVLDENDPIKKGLAIIEKFVRFRDILSYYSDKKDLRALFTLKDKVFLTYTLVDFFDKEFSFIISSNKVEFNVTFINGKRSDLKKDLSATYYKLSGIFERGNEYLKVIKELRKLENDSYMSIQERSARSNQYALQRSQISRVMRKDAKEFFDEFSKKFLVIMADYHTDKKVIQNPDLILEFDRKINGERYCDGKKVVDAIEDAYAYASAMNFLLTDGELGGFSLMAEKSMYLNLQMQESES